MDYEQKYNELKSDFDNLKIENEDANDKIDKLKKETENFETILKEEQETIQELKSALLEIYYISRNAK